MTIAHNDVPDIEQTWPDLFAHLSPQERSRIRSLLIGGWSEGWVPNRADAAAIIRHVAPVAHAR